MTTHFRHVENLKTWQKSAELVQRIQRLMQHFPEEQSYHLCRQLRESAIAISSRMVDYREATGDTQRDTILGEAKGALVTLHAQLIAADNAKLIPLLDIRSLFDDIRQLAVMLRTLGENMRTAHKVG